MTHYILQIELMTPHLFGIPMEFFLFAIILLGVALFHKHTMYVALTGLIVILAFKFITVPDFSIIHHLVGLEEDQGEWKTLLNLAGLLLGFAVLAKYFELSGVPDKLPVYLPDDWKGGLVLLMIIMVLSSFIDNVASAMIEGEPSSLDISKAEQDCFSISGWFGRSLHPCTA